jgi:glycosyltransferase involved in cell wall biosynthesis
MRRPLVSVIVPSFNYGHFLPTTLESVTKQTWDAWECIVVDDGSTDDTSEIAAAHARRDQRIKCVRRLNGGLAAARNTGLRAATGDYVQFLDADDALEPRKLETQALFLERERDAGIVYGGARYFDSISGERRRGLFSDEAWMPEVSGSGDIVLRALLRANIMVVNSALVRRAVVDEVGWFDETLRSLEDWDYWIRCALAGATFRFLDEAGALALVRVHPTSMSQDRVTMHAQQAKLRARMGRSFLGEELYWVNRFWFATELVQLGAELAARGDSLAAARAFLKAALTHPSSRGLEGVKGAARALLSLRRPWPR